MHKKWCRAVSLKYFNCILEQFYNAYLLSPSFYRVTFKMTKANRGSVIARIPKSQGDTALHSLSPDNFSL